jgi:hypothetical protein
MDEKLAILYNTMYEELKQEVESLSGVIDEFDPDNKVISITVGPEYQSYLEYILDEIFDKYEQKKRELLDSDIFSGVRELLIKDH